ncbi:helix-turn-helix domain-containing protein [Streptomyces albiflavescens]|uniref:helix-turn-helix domain-containing protein n=1 Tax=Streptomyces albiflavescens TaxID=1623582 RepID=UPI00166B6C86|nr:helix-turn-helix domain-containing protein [Streptomyces albiflavescens]
MVEPAELMIKREISAADLRIEQMKKPHKLQVVRNLEASGLFLLRDAVEMVAQAPGVTKYTVYNCLNEIHGDSSADR